MSNRAKDISKRIESLRDKVTLFVENLSEDEWKKTCDWEQWPVGVTARHIGASHFAIVGMLEMIIKGETLPQVTMDQINEKSKADAKKHLDCTKAEALERLRDNGSQLAAFVAGLSDEDLDRTGSMPAFGGRVSAEQIIENIIFRSASQHFDSMKAAIGN